MVCEGSLVRGPIWWIKGLCHVLYMAWCVQVVFCGWRIHGGVEVTKLSTNKHINNSLSLSCIIYGV
jgi:hypothetical protein